MARLTHLLSQPERQAANASLAASVEAREATRAAVAHHQPQLLQQPARLSRALARQAWPAAPASAARLQLLLELLLDSERRQRQQRKESAAAAAAAGTAPAASPPPAGLLDHNATLLLALRAAVRYLGRAAPAVDPRALLLLGGKELPGGHTRLSLRAAPSAARALDAAVDSTNATKLALLAPELAACVHTAEAEAEAEAELATGGGEGGGVGGSVGGGVAAAAFAPSRVWLALLRRSLREGWPLPQPLALLVGRIDTHHLAHLITRLSPRLAPRSAEGAKGAEGDQVAAPLQTICELLRAVCSLLRDRAFASLARRATGRAGSAEGADRAGGAEGEAHGAPLGAWRLARRRLQHTLTLCWLAESGEPGGDDAGGEGLLVRWAAAGGEAVAERTTLLRAACGLRNAAAAERLLALRSRWEVELRGRGEAEAGGALSAAALAEEVARWMLSTLCALHAAQPPPAPLGGWAAQDAAEALEALGGVLWLASVPPPLLLAFGADEAKPEALRIGVLGTLHAALRRGGGGAGGGAGGGEAGGGGAGGAAAEVLESLAQLQARAAVARGWPGRAELLEAASRARLGTEAGRAELVALLIAATFPAAAEAHASRPGRAVESTAAAAAALVLAALLQQWRRHVEEVGVDAPPLHAEWRALLGAAAAHQPDLVLRLRAVASAATPLMWQEEEEALGAALRGVGRGGERAALRCALLSGWPLLREAALVALEAGAAPPPDAELLRLLLEQGWLGRMARSPCWARLLPALAAEPPPTLLRVVAELGAAGLYVPAGQVLLHAHRFHPALHSTAAALTLLRKFVATTHDPENLLPALRETLAAWQ